MNCCVSPLANVACRYDYLALPSLYTGHSFALPRAHPIHPHWSELKFFTGAQAELTDNAQATKDVTNALQMQIVQARLAAMKCIGMNQKVAHEHCQNGPD